MKKLNKKAQGSGAISVLAVVVGMLVIGAVILVFVFQFGRSESGSISAGQCKSTIEIVNNYNQKVDDANKAAKDKIGCQTSDWLAPRYCGYPQHWISWGFFNPAIDGATDVVKLNTDLCLENLEASCPNVIGQTPNAADAAECVYKHAVTTYYTLQGGRKNPKYDFNLFKLTVGFDEPGVITVAGKCEDYLTPAAPIIPLNSEDECFPKLTEDKYICGKNQGNVEEWPKVENTCQITFNMLNEQTMNLAMIARCQNETPDSSACKLFADPDKGYSTTNGLPNLIVYDALAFIKADDVFWKNGATYPGKDYGKYSGAGHNSDFFATGDPNFVEIGEGDSKASISINAISTKLEVKTGEKKVCRLRLLYDPDISGTIKGEHFTLPGRSTVYIDGEDYDTPCEELEEEQPQP